MVEYLWFCFICQSIKTKTIVHGMKGGNGYSRFNEMGKYILAWGS